MCWKTLGGTFGGVAIQPFVGKKHRFQLAKMSPVSGAAAAKAAINHGPVNKSLFSSVAKIG